MGEPGLIGHRTHRAAGQVGSQLSIFFSGPLVAFACTGTLIGAEGFGACTEVLRVARPVVGSHSEAPPHVHPATALGYDFSMLLGGVAPR